MKVALSVPLVLLLLTPSLAGAHRKQKTRAPSPARRIASAARGALVRPLRLARRDCSGFIEAVLERAGVHERGNTKSFYADARRERRLHWRKPRPGDLVFFDHTYDRNRNGRIDDPLSHIAIVTAVKRDGTVVMVHRGSRGVRTLRMNLRKPALHQRDRRIYNDFLAAPGHGRRRLAGQLFRAFARPPRR